MSLDLPVVQFDVVDWSPKSPGWVVVRATCPHCSDTHTHAWKTTEKNVWRRPPCSLNSGAAPYWLTPSAQAVAWLNAQG